LPGDLGALLQTRDMGLVVGLSLKPLA
jgi:hypothetical protein